MRPRTIIYLTFAVVLLALAGGSFYNSVLAPHSSGAPAEAIVISGAPSPPTEPATGAGSVVPEGTDALPARLAGLALTDRVDGEEAKLQTEQLHGKGLGQGFDAAWIGRYGEAGEGTLWVSRSASAEDAQSLMDRMTVSIEKGTSPFTNLATAEVAGVPVVSLDGMGQKHYYFRVGTDLYWLGIAPELGESGLEELLDSARRVDG